MRKIELPYETEQAIILYYRQPNSIANTAKFFNQTPYIITQVLNKYSIAKHPAELTSKLQAKQRAETCLKRYGSVCSLQDPKVRQKRDETMLLRYGAKYSGQSAELCEKRRITCIQRYGTEHPIQLPEIKERAKQTSRARYGVDSYTQTDEFKERSKNSCRTRYGVDYFLQSKEFKERSKQTCLKKYGVEFSFQSDNNKQKSVLSKKRNKTIASSSFERDFESFLIKNNIEYKAQYKSELYPFHCDFYLPKSETYIELNLSWTHGKHFFNPESTEDLEVLHNWEKRAERSDYYRSAIDVWTQRDLKKLTIAESNGLNYICVFDIAEIPQLENEILAKEKGVA